MNVTDGQTDGQTLVDSKNRAYAQRPTVGTSDQQWANLESYFSVKSQILYINLYKSCTTAKLELYIYTLYIGHNT